MPEKRTDAGHAAIELALGVGLLLLPAALVVFGFGPWSERAVLAEAIAAESSRAAVLALGVDQGSVVAAEMAHNYGLEPDLVRIGWCGTTPRSGGAGDCLLSRGSTVTSHVQVWVPLINTPWGSMGGLWVERSHSESIDLYRSLP
jgi:hypothetical protein